MKKIVILIIALVLITSIIGARTYTQQVTITNSTVDQTITFDYYNHGAVLQTVIVELYTTAQGGSYEADNDSQTETSDITIHLGASFDLDDNTTAPRLLNDTYSNIWNSDTEATKDTTLAIDDGDGDTFDSSPPDGTELKGIDVTDTKQDSIKSDFVSQYEGTGTFYYTLHKSAINRDDHNGGNIDFKGTSVDVGGYVKITYIDDSPPLPVVLTSFTALVTENNFAQINWTTQSESNLLGYNIYRNTRNDIVTASKITYPMIEGRNLTETQYYSFVDENVEPKTTYYYWLESVDYSGNSNIFNSVEITTNDFNQDPPDINLLLTTGINKIYPNPFNPSTTINYYLNEGTNVEIEIYNLKGQLINKINKGYQEGNSHYNVTWNGKNFSMKTVSSGVYFFKLITNKGVSIKKAILDK